MPSVLGLFGILKWDLTLVPQADVSIAVILLPQPPSARILDMCYYAWF